MKRIINSFGVLIWTIVMLGVGMAALAVRIKEDVSKVSGYNSYIESAREKAAKGIVYYAKKDYLNAFTIYADDRELFQEFLTFLDNSGDTTYRTYLRNYIKKYPEDAEAYEELCSLYMEDENYREVQKILLDASGVGVKSEMLAETWDEVQYKFRNLSGGYSNTSGFYGKQAIVERNGKKGLYQLGSGMVLDAVYEDVSYSVNNVIVVKDETGYYFADNGGHKCAVPDKPVESLSIFANGFSAVSVGGSYGYVNNSLEIPDNLPFEYASAFSNSVAAVKKDGKWGIVDSEGNYIVNPVYDDVKLNEFGAAVSAGVIFVKEGEQWKMIDTQGNKLSEEGFEEVDGFLMAGQPAAVKQNGRWIFVKTTGELFEVKTDYYAVKSYHNGLAPVTLDGEKWGYMDASGDIVIEPQFDDCLQFSEYGVAPVKNGETWSFIQLLMYQD